MQPRTESAITIGAVAVLLACTCTAAWIATQYRDAAQQLHTQIRAGECAPAAAPAKPSRRTSA